MENHLECLQYAREHGCEWDTSTCKEAAAGGHLELLKWARAHEAPWNEDTSYAADSHGHTEVLAWCLDNGCPNFADDPGYRGGTPPTPSMSSSFDDASDEEEEDDDDEDAEEDEDEENGPDPPAADYVPGDETDDDAETEAKIARITQLVQDSEAALGAGCLPQAEALFVELRDLLVAEVARCSAEDVEVLTPVLEDAKDSLLHVRSQLAARGAM
jgi:hypothetical protein